MVTVHLLHLLDFSKETLFLKLFLIFKSNLPPEGDVIAKPGKTYVLNFLVGSKNLVGFALAL